MRNSLTWASRLLSIANPFSVAVGRMAWPVSEAHFRKRQSLGEANSKIPSGASPREQAARNVKTTTKKGVTEALLTARTADTPTLLHMAQAALDHYHGVTATGRPPHGLPTGNSSRLPGL